MIKHRNRANKTARYGKRLHISKQTRRINLNTTNKIKTNKTIMNNNKYKKKRSRHTKTRRVVRTRRRNQTGGGFAATILGDDAINVFRSIPASIGHLVDTVNGQPHPASSFVYPTQQPHVNTISNINSSQYSLLPLNDIYNNATSQINF